MNNLSLYPFLDKSTTDKTADQQTLIKSIQRKAMDSVEVKTRFFDKYSNSLLNTARLIAESYRLGGKLFTMGNGGSSCDASHLAVEFQHPVTAGRPALPAYNLCQDLALTTALGNDVGFDVIFSRQLESHASPNDILVAFSTSGNSKNLMRALQWAKEHNLRRIALLGGDGGEIKASNICNQCLVVESDSIHRIQEVHVACYHILWDITHTLLASDRGCKKVEKGQ